ncbi:hypothetical protein [Clostridium nigeriense]|uniref:hypothetical protein n=1 Tax=Clostridium nigeriense TaxID=1805470 RepID=UPI003D331ED8
MNKKIYTITLLVILMFSITLMRNIFIKDIKEVALSNNNTEKFNEHVLREGKYSFSLPEGWDIDSESELNSDINISFSNKNNIYGNISIVDGDLNNLTKNIAKDNDNTKVTDGDYKWNVITLSENNETNKYYLRNYSDGKVLILKFSYNKGKEKNSIKVVFDYIAMSFK